MININKSAYFFLVLTIISLSIAPAFALGEGNRNLLLIYFMAISPILIIVFNYFHKTDIWLLIFMAFIIIIPSLNHPESMRWSTVFYTCMFCLTFMAYNRLLIKSKIHPNKYLNILKFLIFIYAITLLIQQLCVLLNLPIINISNYDETTPWKLNALASEPSHSARIVGVLMYSYIVIKELILNRSYNLKKDFRYDKWVWIAFIWTMITMQSGTAFLFLPLILVKQLKRRNIIPLILLSIGIFALMNLLKIDVFVRTYNTILATFTLDVSNIIEADHSASFRIIPFIILFERLSIDSLDGLFGYGVDYVSTFLSDATYGIPDGYSGGGLLQVWMEYGFITFLLFIIFSIKFTCIKKHYLSFIFWSIIVFLNGFNSQITWLCIVLLFTNKHFFNSVNQRPLAH